MKTTLTLTFNKIQFEAFLQSLTRSHIELIQDRDKAELVKPIIVDLVLRLMKRNDNLTPYGNLVKLNRIEMVAYRALMIESVSYFTDYYRVIIMETLTAIDKKDIYTIEKVKQIQE